MARIEFSIDEINCIVNALDEVKTRVRKDIVKSVTLNTYLESKVEEINKLMCKLLEFKIKECDGD